MLTFSFLFSRGRSPCGFDTIRLPKSKWRVYLEDSYPSFWLNRLTYRVAGWSKGHVAHGNHTNRSRHPGCPVHYSGTDAGQSAVICFGLRLWFVWNQDLSISCGLIIKDQSTRWTSLRINLRSRTLLEHLSHEKAVSRSSYVELLWDTGHLGAVKEAFRASSHIRVWGIHFQPLWSIYRYHGETVD